MSAIRRQDGVGSVSLPALSGLENQSRASESGEDHEDPEPLRLELLQQRTGPFLVPRAHWVYADLQGMAGRPDWE